MGPVFPCQVYRGPTAPSNWVRGTTTGGGGVEGSQPTRFYGFLRSIKHPDNRSCPNLEEYEAALIVNY